VGRVAANSIDPATGESLGSMSGMEITAFTNNGNGSWSGTFNFLPDRGYNAGALFSNYAARINAFNFTFTPYTAAAPTALQTQIAMSFTGSTRFTYDHDNNPLTAAIYTTGLLPAAGGSFVFGTTLPTVAAATTQSDGSFANRLTVDAEALALDKRTGKAGSGWIGDEYGASLYRFDANKQIVGVLPLPPALVPRTAGNINFLSDPPVSGRRVNQGFDDNGATGGAVVNRNGAQSEIVALNSHQLLVLSRDGNGRGASGSPVFKSVLLADLNGATNINGLFDASTAAAAPGGVLSPTVTPISWTEALNMLGKLGPGAANIELAKFGLNINAGPGDINSISDKWEALALVPVGDVAAPNDYFLFVGNDNDFQSASGKYMLADGTLANYNAGLENDSVVLAWRVQVVPEPATYALMLAGLLGVAAVARRRRH